MTTSNRNELATAVAFLSAAGVAIATFAGLLLAFLLTTLVMAGAALLLSTLALPALVAGCLAGLIRTLPDATEDGPVAPPVGVRVGNLTIMGTLYAPVACYAPPVVILLPDATEDGPAELVCTMAACPPVASTPQLPALEPVTAAPILPVDATESVQVDAGPVQLDIVSVEPLEPAVAYASMKLADLRRLGGQRGLTGMRLARKADVIAALERLDTGV